MPDVEKLQSDLAQLRKDFDAANVVLNYHQHLGYDQTNKLTLQRQIRFAHVGLVDQATIITDATQGNYFYVTLAGSRTLGNPTGAADGQRILFELIQDATGSRVITLGSKFVAGGFTVTLTTTASKRDFLEVAYNQTTDKFYVINFVKNY